MDSETLSNIWASYSFPEIDRFINDKSHNSVVKGLAGSGDALFISDLYLKTGRPLTVFVETNRKAEILAEECQSLVNESSVLLFPSRDAVPYNLKSPFGPTVEARLKVMHQLLSGGKKIIISPYTTLLQRILPRRELFKKIITLNCNDEISIEELSGWLMESGFQREQQVSDIGMFSIRGGIVDVYPFLTEHPIRIEFWGNCIDSIRKFDVFSQKTVDHCNNVMIFPAKEFIFSTDQIEKALEKIEHYCNEELNDINGFHRIDHNWKIGECEGIEWFLHWFNRKTVSILDYLSDETIVVWDDIVPLRRRLDQARNNYRRHRDRAPELFFHLLSSPERLLFSNRYTEELLSCFDSVYIDTLDLHPEIKTYDVSFSEQPQLPYEVKTIADNINAYCARSYRCIFVCPNTGHIERMKELLSDDSFDLGFMIGYLSRGFIDHFNRIVLYSESQIVNRPLRIKKGKKRSAALPLTGYDSLAPDDYVVHEDHGIARFLRIDHVTVGDLKQDCMVLLFGGGTKIYVPVQDFYKVQKYIGKDGHTPQLSKVGSASWEKLKARTRESVKKMAAELIQLYAKRQYFEGIRYENDTLWQKEFEDAFIYTETVDQIQTVKDIKKDMESSKPMDRLVCGDVGFGKTEVAMRAAFKAVMSGYQVAVLAPTTILAAQHYSTFTERMGNFPLKIAVLSRFVKTKKQKECSEKIASGSIDIVIGTHRILSRDIVFRNLGLLIIDEEQRFGVQHKEKIKKLRYKIDVLSLTATPIPRTLHLSLVGARDLSIINTPPQNRLPIETTVCPYHTERVREAVENELERGGQVYFVNNRIKTLELLKDTVEQLVPRARVVIAHGQMNEQVLEQIMKEFIAGRYDVLLSTVIIENGLDIPNVNTIIVNRADTMGLSQLYQLRGRVGRSSEQAYSYFFTPPYKEMSDVSLIRLKALEQYTELGSGFQIAMRDLEIRGAGNILGTRQHGYIEAVGFEMYCRILKEAINEMKGNETSPAIQNTAIEIPMEAYIPTAYVNDGPARVLLYQELSSLTGIEMVTEFEKTVIDRFGPLPQTVNSLIIIVKIRILASSLGISRVAVSKKAGLTLHFNGSDNDAKNVIQRFIIHSSYTFEVDAAAPISLRTTLVSGSIMTQSVEVLELLFEISAGN